MHFFIFFNRVQFWEQIFWCIMRLCLLGCLIAVCFIIVFVGKSFWSLSRWKQRSWPSLRSTRRRRTGSCRRSASCLRSMRQPPEPSPTRRNEKRSRWPRIKTCTISAMYILIIRNNKTSELFRITSMCTQCERFRWSVDSSLQKWISFHSIATRYWYKSELQYCLVANNSYKILNEVPVLHSCHITGFTVSSTAQYRLLTSFFGIIFLRITVCLPTK